MEERLLGGTGLRVSALGLGTLTWSRDTDEHEAAEQLRDFVEAGGTLVDTAASYADGAAEQLIGSLLGTVVAREDLVLVSKAGVRRTGEGGVVDASRGALLRSLDESLARLGTDHLDLWLVHWPPNGQATPSTWQAMRELRDEGLVRAIGVSNYSLDQIDELIAVTGEAPAINQIPWSPSDHDPVLVSGLAQREVALEGYSPFKRTDANHPVLTSIAADHGVTVQQVVLLWHLRHRVVVIPKSVHPERIEANFDVRSFTLSDEEVARIDTLATPS